MLKTDHPVGSTVEWGVQYISVSPLIFPLSVRYIWFFTSPPRGTSSFYLRVLKMLRSKGLHYLPHEILWNLGLTISWTFSHSNMNTFNFCSILFPRWCWNEKIRFWTIIILLKQIRRKIKEIQIEGFFFSKISKFFKKLWLWICV